MCLGGGLIITLCLDCGACTRYYPGAGDWLRSVAAADSRLRSGLIMAPLELVLPARVYAPGPGLSARLYSYLFEDLKSIIVLGTFGFSNSSLTS